MNIENGLRVDTEFCAGNLIRNLKELRERCQKGDLSVLKEFFDMHLFDCDENHYEFKLPEKDRIREMEAEVGRLRNLIDEMFPDLDVLDGFTESIALKRKILHLMNWDDQYVFSGTDTYHCDFCGQEFESAIDVDGDACNRCDEGSVYRL